MPAGITHHTPAAGGTTTIPKASYNEDHDHTLFPEALDPFTAQTDVIGGAEATSNTIGMTGETDLVWPVTVRGDGTPTLQVNETGSWLPHVNVVDGDTIRVKLTASLSLLTERVATVYAPGSSSAFSVTSSDAWEPSDIGAALRAWYPMEPLALANNASIVTLTDASGISNDLTNATSGERPVYKTGVLNSLAVAEFDGSRRLFRSSFSIGTGTGFALASVYRLTADGSYPMILVWKSNTGWEMRHSGGTREPNMIVDAGATNLSSTALTSNTWYIRVDVFDGTGDTAKIFINGTQVATASGVTTAPPSTSENFYIGGRSDGYYLTGQIADAVMCNELSVSDRQKLEGYWAHRFGLTSGLPGDHPYKTTPP